MVLASLATPHASDVQRSRGSVPQYRSASAFAGRFICTAGAVLACSALTCSGAFAGKCEERSVEWLRGKPFSNGLAEKARADSQAGIVLIVGIGEAATADFREDRLVIRIDRKKRLVIGFSCG
jgi:hypothetical protein